MSFLKKISKTALETASNIGSKSSEMIEIGKLKLNRTQLEGKIEDKKIEIGSLVYDAYRNDKEPDKDAVVEIVTAIKELEKEIEEINEKASTIQQKDETDENEDTEEDK